MGTQLERACGGPDGPAALCGSGCVSMRALPLHSHRAPGWWEASGLGVRCLLQQPRAASACLGGCGLRARTAQGQHLRALQARSPAQAQLGFTEWSQGQFLPGPRGRGASLLSQPLPLSKASTASPPVPHARAPPPRAATPAPSKDPVTALTPGGSEHPCLWRPVSRSLSPWLPVLTYPDRVTVLGAGTQTLWSAITACPS